MKSRLLIALLVVSVTVVGVILWRDLYLRPARFGELEKRLSGTFSRYGLNDETVIRREAVQKRAGSHRYYYTVAEYSAPRAFSWKDFKVSLHEALAKTQFRVTGTGESAVKGREVFTAAINRGEFEVMSIRISKRKVAPVEPAAKKHQRPKVAIVIDDFGYNMSNVETFLSIRRPVTLSILPHQPHSREIAELARSRGYEVILHLPLESWRSDVKEESDTIRSGMSEAQIASRMNSELSDIPGADGVSNHMGSKSTEDRRVMADIMRYLKKRGLYYFDSLTSPRSVCSDVAEKAGVRCSKRDRFLDNANDIASIEEQLIELKDTAFERGSAIAVCHDRKNTARALARMMPEMEDEGIEFVRLSALIK